MRRGLASLILGLSLMVASASWAGFVLSHTVLDPGRSEALADTLLDNEAVRAVIVNRLADAIESQIPASVPVTRDTIELGAELALEDPRIEAIVRDGIVQTHQNALAGVDEPVTLDASALGVVGRESVVNLRPELDAALPEAPILAVELPGSGLSWLGQVKDAVDRFTTVSALVALIGAVSALVLARNRPATLRRMAFWAFGVSLFWVVVAYGGPALLDKIAPSSTSIATAIIDIFLGAMVRPATITAGAGVVLLLLSFIWPALARRRPAAMVNRPAPARGALQQGLPVLEGTVRSASPLAAPLQAEPSVVSYPPTQAIPVVSPSVQPEVDASSRFHPDDIGPSFGADSRRWMASEIPTTARTTPTTANDWVDNEAAMSAWFDDNGPTTTSEAETSALQEPAPHERQQEASWVAGVGYVDDEAPLGDRPDYEV